MAPYIPLLMFLTLPFPTSSPQMERTLPRPLPLWDAPRPQAAWTVQGSVGRKGEEWRIDLCKSQFSAFSFTLDPASVRLLVKDHRGRSVPASVSAVQPAPLTHPPNAQFPGEQSFRVDWNVATLKPDMYDISATVRVRATDDATGQPVALPAVEVMPLRFYKTPEPEAAPALKRGQRFLFLPRYESTPDDLKHVAVDAARRKAAKAISDERLFAINSFLALELAIPESLTSSESDRSRPDWFQPRYQMPYVDSRTGEPVQMRDVVLRVFTLEAARQPEDGEPTLEFAVEGRKSRVQVTSACDVEHLPHLTPLVEDDTTGALRAKYEGRWTWFNGGGAFECITLTPRESGSSGTDANVPYKVKRLVRLYQPNETLAIGGAPGYMGPRESEFNFDNPILAVVDIPPKAVLGGLAWGGFALSDAEKNMPYLARDLKKLCAGTVMEFADAWDMERVCRLSDPRTDARGWPARFRAAVAKGELRKGMTPDMVVAAIGWPNEYASPEEMRNQDAWRYDSTPPYSYWVNFKNGRVTSWGPDGQLP